MREERWVVGVAWDAGGVRNDLRLCPMLMMTVMGVFGGSWAGWVCHYLTLH